ncbi:hypothetical protein FE257_007169 [Aspergillus nanangensis]|uniref:Carrier domain-containing protein n=1 Tax=Aspergillus nanangensis TaxID=2582783 RepID=A0AAD4GUF9_ASPNN|nr:hypothetical protein FE257_007169 [Aspergillus nanangensis]
MGDASAEDSVHTVDIIEDWQHIKQFCSRNQYAPTEFWAVVWSITLYRYFDQDVVYFIMRDHSCAEHQPKRARIYRSALSFDMTTHNLFGSPTIIGMVEGVPEDHQDGHTGVWLISEQSDGLPAETPLRPGLDGCKISLAVRMRDNVATLELHNRHNDQLDLQGQHLAEAVAQVARTLSTHHRGKIRDIELADTGAVMEWCIAHQKKRNNSRPQTFLHVLQQRCCENPDALAVCAWDGELTYRQLDVATDCFAQYLIQAGLSVGSLVPICFEKSVYAVVAELGILKAGGAFVPLDSAHPEARINRMLEQIKTTMVVTSTALAQRMSTFGLRLITCSSETTTSGDPRYASPCPADLLDPQQTAYLVYSSGSTGPPSGCVMTHAALVDVSHQWEAIHLTPSSRVLQFASYTFAMSIVQIFCTLAAGGTVCIPSDEDRQNRLVEYMDEARIDWAFVTPSTLNAISEPTLLPSLKTLILAGEPMGRHHIQVWADRVRLYEIYGLSEYTELVAISGLITTSSSNRSTHRNLGLSSPTATTWPADPLDCNRLMPVGAVAELLLEGPGLAQEYLHDPTKTAARFIDTPRWLTGHGRRVYTTGDLVQYLSDGTFRYIGRKDFQAKIRGMKVNLADMEYQISQYCPSIDRAVAETVVPDGSDATAALVVFLNYANGPGVANEVERAGHLFEAPSSWHTQFRLDVSHLKAELPKTLPQHMIPSLYLPLVDIPVTVTGKVDRRRIREIICNTSWSQLQTYALQRVEHVRPQTATEITLHSLFTTVLRVQPDTFGVYDSFLHHGGDSVKAIHLARLCRQAGLTSITFKAIMEFPTIHQLVSLEDEHITRSFLARHLKKLALLLSSLLTMVYAR